LGQKVKTDCGVSFVTKKIDQKSIEEIAKAKGNKVIMIDDTCSQEILLELGKIKADDNVLVAFSNAQNTIVI
jgi:hypothetical protein